MKATTKRALACLVAVDFVIDAACGLGLLGYWWLS